MTLISESEMSWSAELSPVDRGLLNMIEVTPLTSFPTAAVMSSSPP